MGFGQAERSYQNSGWKSSATSSRIDLPVARDRLSNDWTSATSLCRSSGRTRCARVARCNLGGRKGRSSWEDAYTINAPPGVSGSVAPNPAASRASEDTTANAGASSLVIPAASSTVVANETSSWSPSMVCASPSRSATSAPTRIILATSGIASSISQLLNPCKIDSASPVRCASKSLTSI